MAASHGPQVDAPPEDASRFVNEEEHKVWYIHQRPGLNQVAQWNGTLDETGQLKGKLRGGKYYRKGTVPKATKWMESTIKTKVKKGYTKKAKRSAAGSATAALKAKAAASPKAKAAAAPKAKAAAVTAAMKTSVKLVTTDFSGMTSAQCPKVAEAPLYECTSDGHNKFWLIHMKPETDQVATWYGSIGGKARGGKYKGKGSIFKARHFIKLQVRSKLKEKYVDSGKRGLPK